MNTSTLTTVATAEHVNARASDENGLILAKRTALATLLAPILFMASIVQAAILVTASRQEANAEFLSFWLFAHCLIGALFFLISLREKSILFDSASYTESGLTRSNVASALGAVWGIAPAIIAPLASASVQVSFGAVLAGFTFAGGLMLKHFPRLALTLLAPVVLGFLLNIYVQSEIQASVVSVVVLAYFSVIAICTRWYFARYEKKLDDANEADLQARSLLGMLQDLSEATTGYFWRTGRKGVLLEKPSSVEGRTLGGAFDTDAKFFEIFEVSPERDELAARMARRSEIFGLELEVTGDGAKRWYRVTGKPVLSEDGFQGYRGALTDISESKESERRISELAEFDHLTGLPNRGRLHAELEKVIQLEYSDDTVRALIWLDLDNFKWVNDTLGHPAGDELLKRVAGRLQDVCSPEDTIARIGGDEFAIIVERPVGNNAFIAFIQTLTETLAEPYSLWGATARCSASVGFRRFDATTRDSLTLFKHADLALYQSKAKGRATWCEFTNELDNRARARQQLEEDLRMAVDNGELELHFQPIVDAACLRTVGVEALLRWIHPTRGTIYPNEFIELAEDCGLITRIGDVVIRSALRAAADLPDRVRMSINVSPIQMHSESLVPTIGAALTEYDIAPSRLEIEITESVLISDTEFTLQRLKQLKALGLSIALDDFGIGFSSLAYLRQFPFDKIKLDDSFVGDLETSEESRAIAAATLSLARALGLESTAEGVETAYQRDFLRENGCDELQGYFVSRAQPEEALSHFIKVSGDVSGEDEASAFHLALVANGGSQS